jgi:hypothetical protein
MQPRKKNPEALRISGEAKANHGVKPEIKSGRLPEVETIWTLESLILSVNCSFIANTVWIL